MMIHVFQSSILESSDFIIATNMIDCFPQRNKPTLFIFKKMPFKYLGMNKRIVSVLFKSKCCSVKNMLCSACNSFTQAFFLRQTVYFGNRTALCVLGFS